MFLQRENECGPRGIEFQFYFVAIVVFGCQLGDHNSVAVRTKLRAKHSDAVFAMRI